MFDFYHLPLKHLLPKQFGSCASLDFSPFNGKFTTVGIFPGRGTFNKG